MIASSARTVRPLARQALRQNAAIKSSSSATLLSASQRRMASSDTAKGAIEKAAKSDAPWAIGSLVVFGSMFIYLTSPPKGGKHGHGHENEQHEESDDDSDTLIDAENTTYDNPNKIELKPGKNSPAGGQHLAEKSLSAEDGAHLQKKTKSASDINKPDDITFKTGVAAAKEGHGKGENSHMSDPKKVVADAHAKRNSNKDQAADGEDVENSVEAADANAQNENTDDEIEDSQAIHDSENAKKANEINEAEGSDKED